MFSNESALIDPALATADRLEWPEFARQGIGATVLRLDKIHPVVSGNKWFKLKEHLRIAAEKKSVGIVSFGGAWSNHIVATAYAARMAGLRATGIIRGERGRYLVGYPAGRLPVMACGLNLSAAKNTGEKTSRTSSTGLCRRLSRMPIFCPEGGGGPAGVKGAEEIGSISWKKGRYSHILCAIGTGTMYLGLALACAPKQKVIGIPVLKGLHHLLADCKKKIGDPERSARCEVSDDYHFGGYARKTDELLRFYAPFVREYRHTYRFCVYRKIILCRIGYDPERGLFPPGPGLLVIHSGGLQGNRSLPPGTLDF